MYKDYLTQQLVLLDSINGTLDDMLELAKHHCRPFDSVDDESKQIQQHGVYMMHEIKHKMIKLGLL